MKAGNWFRFSSAEADTSVADIHIIDFIGDWYDDASNRFWGENIGLTARAFVEALSKLPSSVKAIRVHINSPGGDVQAGINIANALRAEQAKGRTVETVIDGVAASIASVIAMAGSKVVMADNALMMIHDPMTIAVGNAAEFEKAMGFLASAKAQIIATYKWHATIDDAELGALMSAETWMTADEALAAGLITDKVEGLKAEATLTRASIAKLHVPDVHRARVDALLKPEPAPVVPPVFDALPIISACNKAGFPELAEAFVGAKASIDQVTAQLAEARATRDRQAALATDIRATCALVNLPELADGYITVGAPLETVKAHLTVLKAKLDKVEIDSALPVDGKAARTTAAKSWDAAFTRVTGASPAKTKE